MTTDIVIDPVHVRRQEAVRLMVLAKGMLTAPAEEMAGLYLDHALSALAECSPSDADAGHQSREDLTPARVPVPDHG